MYRAPTQECLVPAVPQWEEHKVGVQPSFHDHRLAVCNLLLVLPLPLELDSHFISFFRGRHHWQRLPACGETPWRADTQSVQVFNRVKARNEADAAKKPKTPIKVCCTPRIRLFLLLLSLSLLLTFSLHHAKFSSIYPRR